MKPLSTDTLLARSLHGLAIMVIRHPKWFVWPQIVLAIASIIFTIGFLKFDPDQNNLVAPNLKYQQNFLRLQTEFPQQGNDLEVVVQSDDLEKNRQFIERLAAKMIPETNLFCDVFYQHDLAAMGTKALFFVPEDDLASIRDILHDELPFMRQFTQTTNLPSFFEQINEIFRNSPADTNAQTDALVQSLPFLTSILNQTTTSLQSSGKPPSPGVSSLFGAKDASDIYITFDHGRIFLVTTHRQGNES